MSTVGDAISDDTVIVMVTVLLLFTLYFSLRGLVQLFQRHNSILVIFYLVFLFPIAYCHILILGFFGRSKKRRRQKEVEEEADRQIAVEKIKAKRK